MIKRNLNDKSFLAQHIWIVECLNLTEMSLSIKCWCHSSFFFFTEEEIGLFHPTLIFRDKSNFRLPISFMWLLGGLWVWETWLSFYFYQLFYERKSILVAPTQEEVSLFALPPRKQFGNFLPYFNLEDITQIRAVGLIKIS